MSTLAPARRILIVVKDRQLGDLLVTMLQLEGYQTEVATSLAEALGTIEGQLYDLVVTDLFVTAPPDRQGTAFLHAGQQLRQRCHPIPVGILTGWPVDPEAVERAGFAFALQKPFDLDVILQRIADRLNPPFTPDQQQQAHLLRRFLQAVGMHDGETLRALCTPGVCYYPLTRTPLTDARQMIGIEAYLTYVHQLHQRLPELRFEHVVIVQQGARLIARSMMSWQGEGGQRLQITGSLQCRFLGERISRIGEALPAKRLRELLEAQPPPTGR